MVAFGSKCDVPHVVLLFVLGKSLVADGSKVRVGMVAFASPLKRRPQSSQNKKPSRFEYAQ